MKKRIIRWAIRKKIDEHSEEIQAEITRIRSLRSIAEFKAYGGEKGAELKKLWQERGPEIKRALKEEYARFKAERAKKEGK